MITTTRVRDVDMWPYLATLCWFANFLIKMPLTKGNTTLHTLPRQRPQPPPHHHHFHHHHSVILIVALVSFLVCISASHLSLSSIISSSPSAEVALFDDFTSAPSLSICQSKRCNWHWKMAVAAAVVCTFTLFSFSSPSQSPPPSPLLN